MRYWPALLSLLLTSCAALAHDMGWLLEQAPRVSAILGKSMERYPSFTAKVEVVVSSSGETNSTAASGGLRFVKDHLRWEVNLTNIRSPHLTSNTRAAVKQLNGERMAVLTRLDQKSNYLLLLGARAYIEEPLPEIRLVTGRDRSPVEAVDGRECVRVRQTVRFPDGTTNELILWRPKEAKHPPVQFHVCIGPDRFEIKLRDVRFRALSANDFVVPQGLSRYTTLEDLVQSVVLDRLKRRMGL